MLTWLAANLVNIVLVLAVAAVCGLIIRGMVRDRKQGKSACGYNCGGCAGCAGCASGGCHPKNET